MPFKSIKSKINNLASGEILGNTIEETERKEQEGRHESGVPKKKKPKKENKSIGESFFKRKTELVEEIEEPKQKKQKSEQVKIKPKDAIPGYDEVLSLLGIKEVVNSGMDFESSDLDYIEFTQTTPVGFDFDEVTDFISRMKYILNRYENLLRQRDKEIIILASEVKKIENKMVEAKQALELEKMMGGMTEEERLIEENMDLRVELNKLKSQMNKKGNPEELDRLNKTIELLKSENEILSMRLKEQSKGTKGKLHPKDGLPVDFLTSTSQKGENSLPPMEAGSNNAGTLPTFEEFSERKEQHDIYMGEEPEFTFEGSMGKRAQEKDPLEDMLKDI